MITKSKAAKNSTIYLINFTKKHTPIASVNLSNPHKIQHLTKTHINAEETENKTAETKKKSKTVGVKTRRVYDMRGFAM